MYFINNNFIFIIIIILAISYFYNIRYKNKQKRQLKFIKSYSFPKRVLAKVKDTYPHLSDTELNTVLYALRDYFFIANKTFGKTIAMPSKVVDVAWHEFIIFTKEYEDFCNKAFGRFFHHTPTEPIAEKDTIDESLRLTWKIACFKENIMPSAPDKLPLLFSIDKKLKIQDGNIYTLGNNLTNTLASHRYGCGGGDSAGGSCGGGHSFSSISCDGGSSCGGGCSGS